ncbi:hypothetical protein HZ994_06575 [Akkermansiaceae bacterium]|nr:hypothetical protein HZ994_06575 [Akkermansiaceae bacterium]
MGLERIGAATFLSMKGRGIPMGSLLTFGRQHFAVSPRDVRDVPGLSEIMAANPELTLGGDAFAEPFFKAVGVGTVESMDASAYESCSLLHDLNNPIPEEWHGRYDIVFDGGTLEHVFHFPNAIANAMNLVKVGGVFVSATPSNNYNGHGFYQFSPELFFRLFNGVNGFRVLMMALSESAGRKRIFRVQDPADLGRRISFPGDGPLELVMIAQRCDPSPALSAPPYQSDYSATWKQGTAKAGPGAAASPLRRCLRGILPERLLVRYDSFRWARMHKKRMQDGVTLVRSIDECMMLENRPQRSIPIHAPGA